MNKLTYHREGDYLLPDLVPPASPRIGFRGMRRRDYLKKRHAGDERNPAYVRKYA